MIGVKSPLFKLGQVVATQACLEALQRNRQSPWEFLSRHVVGDWGVVDNEDKALNDQSVKDGSRILSAYVLKDATKIWCISDAEDDNGNRAVVTLLLPSDY